MRPSLSCSRAEPRAPQLCSRAEPRASTSLVRLLLGALCAWLLGQPAAHASLVEALDLATLVAESDQVVVARVLASDSHFDEQGQIVTDVTMQVEESVKGQLAPGAVVTVRRKGGTVGDIGMRVSGEPSFSVGETVVLFAARGSSGVLRPVGMSQGALRVFEKDGARWARGANGGVAMVKRGKSGKLDHAPGALPAPRRLDELLGELRSLVGKH